jgi:hypothetical protein
MAKKKQEEELSTDDLAERAEREGIVDPKFPSGAKARDEAAGKAPPEEKLHDLIAPFQTGAVGVTLDSGESLTVQPGEMGLVAVPERFVEKLLAHGFRREQK